MGQSRQDTLKHDCACRSACCVLPSRAAQLENRHLWALIYTHVQQIANGAALRTVLAKQAETDAASVGLP